MFIAGGICILLGLLGLMGLCYAMGWEACRQNFRREGERLWRAFQSEMIDELDGRHLGCCDTPENHE